MLNGKTAIAWALYDELMNKGLSPHQETWESLFLKVCTSPEGEGEDAMSPAEHQDRLLAILQHMRNNQVYPQLGVARSIKTWFKRYKRVFVNFNLTVFMTSTKDYTKTTWLTHEKFVE